MRQFSVKELLLLTSPIAILGLGIWGAKIREGQSPNMPSVSCEVRQPTPLEISQGAQIAVTVHAVAPRSTFLCPGLDYTLNLPKERRDPKSSIWYDYHSKGHENHHEIEENHAYNVVWKKPLTAIVGVHSSCGRGRHFEKQVELDASGVTPVNAVAARRPNFRLVKAFLRYEEVKGVPERRQHIDLQLEDVSDESGGLMNAPRCVGNWVWQDKRTHSVPVTIGLGYGTSFEGSDSPTTTIIGIDLETAKLQVPPRKGTLIKGSFSIKMGWPQQVTFEWPEKLNRASFLTEMKFTTKLAPFPNPK